MARSGFKPGMCSVHLCDLGSDSLCVGFYGRLGKDEHFYTTVTNVEPTAKQCWVLHPEVSRLTLYLFI